jgi:hypothetical protein
MRALPLRRGRSGRWPWMSRLEGVVAVHPMMPSCVAGANKQPGWYVRRVGAIRQQAGGLYAQPNGMPSAPARRARVSAGTGAAGWRLLRQFVRHVGPSGKDVAMIRKGRGKGVAGRG